MEDAEVLAFARAVVLRELVGHVVERGPDGEPVVVRVVECGWLDEPGPGLVGDTIEHDVVAGVPQYRVWRAVDPM